ncbi:hypothetical protein [Dehalobacterium formicoaceticum]|uniref:hypothetical protein n=1 Tax=Dehalobacterium formicoaceticum TaxID=51515 RepID=UPI0031F69327
MSSENLSWKRYFNLKNLIITAIIISIIISGAFYLQESTNIVPQELLNTALTNTLEAKSYQFHTKSSIIIDGQEKTFSDIAGERGDSKTFHVTGSMLGTDINVYQIGDTTYRLDSLTNKWIVTENNSLLRESLLMAELNPLSNFYFKEIVSAEYLGMEKIDRHKMYKITCQPRINNKWLDGYFKDLNYIIWIDKKDKMIKKATMTAISKEKESSSLTIEVILENFNKEFNIKPPSLSS